MQAHYATETLTTAMDYTPHEGPYVIEHPRPVRKICNMCRYCNKAQLFTQRSSDILDASCRHPSVTTRLFGNYLEHNRNDVHTPDWCPIEKDKENPCKPTTLIPS